MTEQFLTQNRSSEYIGPTWTKIYSVQNCKYYYWHKTTNKVYWEIPIIGKSNKKYDNNWIRIYSDTEKKYYYQSITTGEEHFIIPDIEIQKQEDKWIRFQRRMGLHPCQLERKKQKEQKLKQQN